MRYIAASCIALALASAAEARVPSTKTVILPSSGARADITVPYTTNGRSTLGVSNGVGPIIYSYPNLNAQGTPGSRPVYNLIFYGSKLTTSNGNIAAGPAQPNILKRGRQAP